MRSLVVVAVLLAGCPGAPGVDAGDDSGVDSGSVCAVALAVPSVLDFGAVARGDTFTLTVTLKNTQPVESVGFVGDVVSAQGDGVYGVTADSPHGTVLITPNFAKTVTFTFTPTEARDYFATITLRAADGCADQRLRLIGTGVDQTLTWAPAIVDYGYAVPGTTAPGEVVFSNQAFKPIAMTSIGAFEGAAISAVFVVTATDQSDLTRLTVPAATRDPQSGLIVPATAKIITTFTPAALGPKTGQLKVDTDVRSQGHIIVQLRGFGGGPAISLSPSPTLSLGRMAYFAGSVSAVTRKVTLSNVGVSPTPPDPRANLRLGDGGIGQPYWSVVPGNAGTLASELCVGAFDTATNTCTGTLPTYDPGMGIVADAGIEIPIRFTPDPSFAPITGTSVPKEWEVTFLSNDRARSGLTLAVQATTVMLPPCVYSVTPTTLDFGVMTPASTRDLTFQVHNNASNAGDVCVISSLDLAAGSSAVFTLPAGPIVDQELDAGDTLDVVVRATAQGPAGTVQGRVGFNVSSPGAPTPSVGLAATLTP